MYLAPEQSVLSSLVSVEAAQFYRTFGLIEAESPGEITEYLKK